MDDMNESADVVEQVLQSSMRRREFLTKAAAAGAVAWAAPVILSRPAYGVEGGEGTPKCRPTVKVCCTRYFCEQGGKYFPGIAVTVGDCPCAPGTCPTVCVRIVNVTHTAGSGVTIVAYGPGTTCGPLQQGGSDVGNMFSDGAWHCLPSSGSTIFFGKERVGRGAIGDIGSATVCFDMAVWAGCPDRSPQDGPAYTCETHRYCVGLGPGNTPRCTCDNPSGPAASLCDGTGFSPCPPTCGPGSGCRANPPCPKSVEPPATQIDSTPIVCPSP